MSQLVSIVVYLIILFISWLFVLLSVKDRNRRKVYIFISLLALCLFGVVRYATGADYSNYLEIYQFFATGEELGASSSYFNQIEPIFQILSKLSYFLTRTPILFFGIPWISTVLLFYFSMIMFFEKDELEKIPLAWLSVLIFVIPLGFDQIRQTLAVSLITLSIVLIIKKKLLWSILPAVLSIFSHYSSIFVILFIVFLLIIRFIFNNKNYKAQSIYIIIGGAVISLILVTLFFMLKDQLYATKIVYLQRIIKHVFSETDGFKIMGIFRINYWLIILLYTLCASFIVVYRRYSKSYATSSSMGPVLPIMGMGCSLAIFGFFIPFGGRLSHYFLVISILALIKVIKNRRKIIILYLCSLLMIVLMFFCNWNWILPYNTIWHKVDLNNINRHHSLYNRLFCALYKHKCILYTNQEYDIDRLWRLN